MKMKKRILGLLMVLTMVISTMVGCAGSNEEVSKESTSVQEKESTSVQEKETKSDVDSESHEEKVVTVGTTSAWATLCHLDNVTDNQVVFTLPVFDTWVTISSKGEVMPRLFESWKLSEDGSTMDVHLREDSYWHDGEQVTANDVYFTYRLLADPKFEASVYDGYKYLTGTDDSGKIVSEEEFGIEVIDDFNLRIKIKVPTSETNFFYQFRTTPVVPEHLLADIPVAEVETNEFWEHPIGSGPFKFDSYIDGERIEYTAFDDYYMGRPDFDRLIIRVIPESNMMSALMSGEVDITARGSQISMNDYIMATKDDTLQTYSADGFGNVHILINNQNVETAVRLAMDHAIDKESIVNDLLYGNARTAISAIVPENPFRLEGIEGNAYDPELAKQILEEAGWDSSKTLRFLVSSSSDLYNQIAVLVQQNLAAVGIKVEIENYDSATIFSALFDGDYDLSIQGSASNAFEPSESQFYFNEGGWLKVERTDGWLDLYEKGLEGTTIEERRVYYDQLQEKLVEEVPMIFLYHADNLFVYSSRLSNIPFENIPLNGWYWWDWKVAE